MNKTKHPKPDPWAVGAVIASPSTTHPFIDLLLILLLAAALRAYAFGYLMLDPDSCQYLDLAREIAGGDYFRSGYNLDAGIFISRRLMPVYPALVALAHLAGASLPLSGYLVSWLADLAGVAVAWRIGGRAAGRAGAALAGIFIACSPAHVDYANAALSESLFVFLTLALFDAALAAAASPRLRAGALAGGLAALAYLTREIGLVYVPLFASGGAAWILLPGRPDHRRVLLTVAGFIIAFVLVAVPFWVSVRERTGDWQLSLREGVARSITLPEAGAELVTWRSELFLHYAGRLATDSPLSAFWLAAAVALAVAGGRNRRLAAAALAGALGTAAASALVGPLIFTDRYLIPARSLIEVAAAVALAQAPGLARRLHPRHPRLQLLLPVLAAAVWLVAGANRAGELHRARNAATPLDYDREIGKVCADLQSRYQLPPGLLVMDRKPFAAFWLDGRLLSLPASVTETDRIAAEKKPDLIVLDSAMIRNLLPNLMPMLAGDLPPPGMKLIYQTYLPRLEKLYTVYGRADLAPPALPSGAGVEAVATYLAAGDLFDARRVLERVLKTDPGNMQAQNLFAMIEMIVASVDSNTGPAEARVREMERMAPQDPRTKAARKNLERLREQIEKMMRR